MSAKDAPIITMNLVSSTDNSAQQYISADRLQKLEAIERAAVNLVSLQRALNLGYRELEDTLLKFKD